MLKYSVSNIKYFMVFVLALLMAMPLQANAGITINFSATDEDEGHLTYFWDLRDRESYLQVTNTDTSAVTVHVQIFNVNGDTVCEEVDFPDTYTANDTHVYDIRNLTRNDGLPAPTPDFTDGYGFAVISVSSGDLDNLIGMFRIVDDAGYEYRTNAAAGSGSDRSVFSSEQVLPFNDINGNNLSDIVGILWEFVDGSDGDTVYASPSLSITFGGTQVGEVLIFDELENPQSCSPVTFTCAPGSFIYGIDNSLPPSQGGSEICNASTLNANTAGWLKLPAETWKCDEPNCFGGRKFFGFIGLNNSDGTGSMDSWWQKAEIRR